MKAAVFKGKRQIEIGDRPNPTIQHATDAIVRVVRGCVCGSDLWYYRGINQQGRQHRPRVHRRPRAGRRRGR